MDNLREKLIKLLWEYDQMRMMRMSIEECVDHLIANGVTVQKTNSQMQEEARAREAVIVDLRKKWQAAEALICTMCRHCEYEEAGGILRMQTDCGEICGYPCCGKFTPRDRWIPVTERLPEESGEYLVATRRGNLHVLSYSARHKAFNAFDDISNDAEVRCSHWMPLPEPPKEVE